MTWSYDPEDIPEVKHRDALRGELPPGAMRPEPSSAAERSDMYAHGDPMLRYHLDTTQQAEDALAKHRRDTADEFRNALMDTGHHDINEAAQHAHLLDPASPGDHLLNPTPDSPSEMDEDDDEVEGEPYYHVWDEGGDYVGGSKDRYKARGIMGGAILNHKYDDPDCPGCGVMTPPADHGFSIQPTQDEGGYGEDLSPRFSRVAGAVSRNSDTVWR